MPATDAMRGGSRMMTVCNACRYCEQYCPVFPAMERRVAFPEGDLAFLANLCHNCGECLYACQYAPPHEFGINLPRTFAEVRLQSYEDACWPGFMRAAFRSQSAATALSLALGMSGVILALAQGVGAEPVWPSAPGADFYGVVPHHALVAVFGAASAFVVAALAVGATRIWRRMNLHSAAPSIHAGAAFRALTDAMTLRHLHPGGVDCTDAEESRRPWRRRCHHAMAYGFLLCFASTSVAALYHVGLGWRAPYGYTSLPVALGTVGGLGLLAGPIGLLWLRRHRDPALGDPGQHGLDVGLLSLLILVSLTGLLLLALRQSSLMGGLLVVHLGAVMALFLALPYGKFVHGIYRTAALLKDAAEQSAERTGR